MAFVPGICAKCGTVLPAIDIGNTQFLNLAFNGQLSMGCPVPECGGSVIPLDGQYSGAGNVLKVLANTPVSRAQWGRLADILERARANGQTGAQIADEIERELPIMKAVAAEFRRTPLQASAAAAVLATSLLSVLAMFRPSGGTSVTNVDNSTHVTYVQQAPAQPAAPTKPLQAKPAKPTPGARITGHGRKTPKKPRKHK